MLLFFARMLRGIILTCHSGILSCLTRCSLTRLALIRLTRLDTAACVCLARSRARLSVCLSVCLYPTAPFFPLGGYGPAFQNSATGCEWASATNKGW